ncbi:NAD(P)/FAD-dependent oxidoreductase [Mycoplasmopsis gallinarum]|uniref:NAD(P)/FAD-dependent oxidoreductase n=1 Tax=Mycoplasmopsis gallinarum TaxID=29557 RepID=UPI000488C31E|nr:FAD-dependent oxidoreductase [Mycoplasmopsis gallinarum]
MNKVYDVIIIGTGPGGLNAALYGSRAGLNVAIIDKGAPGGKLSQTAKIENWLGTEIIEGYELAIKMFDHAIKFGAEYKYGNVKSIQKNKELFEIYFADEFNETMYAKNVIVATGMKNKEPNWIENYETYKYKGISFCATCDGPIFKDQNVVVIGGGNSAIEESTFLANIVNDVYLIVRDNQIIAEQKLIEDLKKHTNVHIHMNSEVIKILGNENQINTFVIKNNLDNSIFEINANGFFPFIGLLPNNQLVNNFSEILNESGFIRTDENMQTKVKGLYAVGDIREKHVRQIVTAAADGAIAIKNIVDSKN